MKKVLFLISLMVVAVMSVNAKAAKADAARRAYYEAYISYDMSRVPNWKFPKYIMLGESINLPYTIDNYGDDMSNVTVSLMVNGEEADKNQIASIITDEDMGEGTYAGQFTYTPTAVGNLEIQLVLTFDGDEEDEGGEHESELLTISVVNETPEPDAIANIADLKSYEGGDVLLTLTDAKVTYSGTVSTFDYDVFNYVTTDVVVFEDATAGICLQGSGLGSLVTAGQILNGKLAMTTATGFGSVSAKLTNGINGVEVTNGELTPLVLTSDNVSSFLANCEWRLITLPEATVKKVSDEDGGQYTINSSLIGEYSLQNALNVSIALPEEDHSVSATGYIYSTFAGLEFAFQPLNFTNVATSISSLRGEENSTAAYLLNGARATNASKGLHILHGRKVLKK